MIEGIGKSIAQFRVLFHIPGTIEYRKNDVPRRRMSLAIRGGSRDVRLLQLYICSEVLNTIYDFRNQAHEGQFQNPSSVYRSIKQLHLCVSTPSFRPRANLGENFNPIDSGLQQTRIVVKSVAVRRPREKDGVGRMNKLIVAQ